MARNIECSSDTQFRYRTAIERKIQNPEGYERRTPILSKEGTIGARRLKQAHQRLLPGQASDQANAFARLPKRIVVAVYGIRPNRFERPAAEPKARLNSDSLETGLRDVSMTGRR